MAPPVRSVLPDAPRVRNRGSAARRVGLLIRLLAAWLRRDLLLVDISGRSMEPALASGDRVFCSRRTPLRKDAIVVRELKPSAATGKPHYQVKRLIGLAGDEFTSALLSPGWCWIEGDNQDFSTDSRTLGPIPRSELIAVAIARLRHGALDDLRQNRTRRRQSLRERLDDWWDDRRRGVTTRGTTTAASFGFSPVAVRPYHATPWRVIRHAFDAAQVDATDVLLDYGCGKGRVLVEATRYPFRRILGIDIVPELVAIARANVADARCEVYCADAASFVLPDDVTVIYLFNPFDWRVHLAVARALNASLERRHRRVRVLAYRVQLDWLRVAPRRTGEADLLLYALETTHSVGE